AAHELLQRAATALGGAQRLFVVSGCTGTSTTRTGHGPEVVDREWYVRGVGLRRERRILATTIASVFTPEGGTETVGRDRRSIGAEEARVRIAAWERHPVFLLVRFLRGEDRYRLVSQRRVGDRDHALLERVGEGPPLRLHVDVGSALVCVDGATDGSDTQWHEFDTDAPPVDVVRGTTTAK